MPHKPDILDEIINHLDPELIPTEFIVMAKVRTYDGREAIVTGPELEDFMSQNEDQIADVRVILNVRSIRNRILETTEEIFERARQF